MSSANDITAQPFGPDRNDVTLVGTLATTPEHRTFGSGATLARLLVTVRLHGGTVGARTDVIPVTVWEPDPKVVGSTRGRRIKVTGQVHRRFWTDAEGRHSRVEVVATELELQEARDTDADYQAPAPAADAG